MQDYVCYQIFIITIQTIVVSVHYATCNSFQIGEMSVLVYHVFAIFILDDFLLGCLYSSVPPIL